MKDVQTALGEDCPIAPVFEYVTVPEEVTGAVDTVSASVADVNKVILDAHHPHTPLHCVVYNSKLINMPLQNFYSYYNCGVMTVLNGIRDLPDTASKYANQVLRENCKFSFEGNITSLNLCCQILITGGGGC